MNEPLLILTATGLFICLVGLACRTRSAAQARDRSRLSYFERCAALVDQCRTGRSAAGLPRLAGRYRGHSCDLQAVPDTLTFRKLPALWVLVTIPDPIPVRATLDLMIRPTGLEPFSAFGRLAHEIAAPAGFPEESALRTDDPEGLISAEILRPHLALFENAGVKELVISPKGLRIVFLAEEADRSRYLIFRDAEMARVPLDAGRVRHVLDRLLMIRTDIERMRCDSLEGDAA